MTMHADQVEVTEPLVRGLIDRQLPQYAGLPLTPVPEHGTDHALFRRGDELVARMPVYAGSADQAASAARWLSVLAPYLPVAVPVPLAVDGPDATTRSRGRSRPGCRGSRRTATTPTRMRWRRISEGSSAPDLQPAWATLPASVRAEFRAAVGYDDDTWRRGRGWALAPALTGIPYYWDTVPAFAQRELRTVAAVLEDLRS